MDDNMRAITREIADEVAEITVSRTLISLGINYNKPIEVQRNMASIGILREFIEDPEVQKDLLHLRRWRKTMDSVQNKGFIAALGFACVGGIALILYAFHIKGFRIL